MQDPQRSRFVPITLSAHDLRHTIHGKPTVHPIVEALNQWRENFLELRWVIESDWHVVHVRNYLDPDRFEEVCQTYRDHGWPDNFRATEFLSALDSLQERFDREDQGVDSSTDESDNDECDKL